MVLMQDQHRFNLKAWLLWTAGFVAFIIGGALATGVVGRINDLGSALIGGMIAGAVIGTGQWLVARRLLGNPQTWIPATAVAMGKSKVCFTGSGLSVQFRGTRCQ